MLTFDNQFKGLANYTWEVKKILNNEVIMIIYMYTV